MVNNLNNLNYEFRKNNVFEINKIYNGDCKKVMSEMEKGMVDVILTSPFYNSNKKAGKKSNLTNTKVKEGQYNYVRYDVHVDNMTDDEYCDYTVDLFGSFDHVLKENGVILYNLSYGSENVECMFRAVNDIITRTNFTVADCIIWKKKNAMPNSCSPNKLTRIVEYVFVICRKNEIKTFQCNKKVTSLRKTGQKAYENIYNLIEAKNNDGSCPFNKATYSSDLCNQLLSLYAKEGDLVFDPFMGTGTTAVSCVENKMNFIGSEISENQCSWANERIIDVKNSVGMF